MTLSCPQSILQHLVSKCNNMITIALLIVNNNIILGVVIESIMHTRHCHDNDNDIVIVTTMPLHFYLWGSGWVSPVINNGRLLNAETSRNESPEPARHYDIIQARSRNFNIIMIRQCHHDNAIVPQYSRTQSMTTEGSLYSNV